MRSLSKGIVHDAIRCRVFPAWRKVRHRTAGPGRVLLIVAALLALVLSTAPERAWASPSIRATSSAADLAAAEAFTLQTPVGALPGDVLLSGLDLRLPGTVEVTPPVGRTPLNSSRRQDERSLQPTSLLQGRRDRSSLRSRPGPGPEQFGCGERWHRCGRRRRRASPPDTSSGQYSNWERTFAAPR